ncbi:MAG: polyphenol oxidase family protein [Bdellovibrionia bacterium]
MTEFTPVRHENSTIGKEIFLDDAHIFFGNRFATVASLEKQYPKYRFHFVKQVHGNAVAEAPFAGEADAHWTTEKNTAVGVYTADCLPVLLHSSSGVAAIHAGWRGVANEIIPKVFSTLKLKVPVRAYIGPHIRRSSFEVGLDVANTLERVGPPGVSFSHNDPAKKYIDLTAIAKHQLLQAGLDPKLILVDADNTYDNSDYVSYRRLGAGCGRLISFIALHS